MFVVTGGGSGIGRQLAHALAARGKQVLIIGRRLNRLKETAAPFSNISICCADVAQAEGRQQVVAALAGFEQIEALIHNAGTILPISTIESIELSTWQQCLDTNVGAPLFLTQLLLPKLHHARVLNIGSGAAYFPVKGWAAYCTSKAALSMLTQCWQHEIPYDETAFASVMPGIIDTDMQAVIRQASCMAPDKQAFFQKLHQKHQLVPAQLVAQFLCWLLLEVPVHEFAAKEWDIYDKSHHTAWLGPNDVVPSWE